MSYTSNPIPTNGNPVIVSLSEFKGKTTVLTEAGAAS